jgi:hypothetical protein
MLPPGPAGPLAARRMRAWRLGCAVRPDEATVGARRGRCAWVLSRGAEVWVAGVWPGVGRGTETTKTETETRWFRAPPELPRCSGDVAPRTTSPRRSPQEQRSSCGPVPAGGGPRSTRRGFRVGRLVRARGVGAISLHVDVGPRYGVPQAAKNVHPAAGAAGAGPGAAVPAAAVERARRQAGGGGSGGRAWGSVFDRNATSLPPTRSQMGWRSTETSCGCAKLGVGREAWLTGRFAV